MQGTSLSPEALDSFIDAAARTRAVYFLGAGTSAAIIALTDAIPPVIRKRVVEAGFYTTEGYKPSTFRTNQKLTPYEPGLTDKESFAFSGTPEAAVQAHWDHLLISPKDETATLAYERPFPEYRYFELVPDTSAIVTTNNDGLTGWVSHRLCLVELHGSPFDLNVEGESRKLPLRDAEAIRECSSAKRIRPKKSASASDSNL